MAKKDNNEKEPSIDLWQVSDDFDILCKDGNQVRVKKNELLFLLGKDGDYLIFQTEISDLKCKLHKEILKTDKIKKVL